MSNITTTPQAMFNPAKYDTTQDFYASKGKKFKMPAQIGKRKETELEELYWTDKVFTGDNPAATVFHLSQVNQRHQNQTTKKTLGAADNSKPSSAQKHHSIADSVNMKHKNQLNAEAEAETQLVHLKNTVTGEGKVDIAKV